MISCIVDNQISKFIGLNPSQIFELSISVSGLSKNFQFIILAAVLITLYEEKEKIIIRGKYTIWYCWLFFTLFMSSQYLGTVGQKKLKSIFCNFKYGQKSIFELEKSFYDCQKCNFTKFYLICMENDQKIFREMDLFDFTSFLPGPLGRMNQ